MNLPINSDFHNLFRALVNLLWKSMTLAGGGRLRLPG